MCLELQIIQQQIERLSDRPGELEKVFNMVRLARATTVSGLSEKEYKKRLRQTASRLEKSKHFKP